MTHHTPMTVASAMERVATELARRKSRSRRPVCYLPGNAGRIASVEEWIFANAGELAGVDMFQALALGPKESWTKAVMGGVGIVTPFIGPGVRDLVNKGLAQNIRTNLSQAHKLYKGRWRPDVAFAHVSPPDMIGRVTLGLNAGIDISAVKSAQCKVAIVNQRMPRWNIDKYFDEPTGRLIDSGCAMKLDEFDIVVSVDEPLTEHPMVQKSTASQSDNNAIANNIVDFLLRDVHRRGEKHLPHILQLGIGTLPDALARRLAERGLSVRGVWSELFSDGVMQLYGHKLIRHRGGALLREHIVVGIMLGTGPLYEMMRENPDFAVLPQEIVNDPAMIRHNPHTVSINSAINVDLKGDVAAATIRKRYYSDVGGQFDFALGASWADDGVALIALPSVATLRDGSQESKIVAVHSEGAHHTISADLPVVVVTEQGVADLRGLHDPERVEAMLRIAHPSWREHLEKEARMLPSMQGVGVLPPRLVTLTDGRSVLVRPATKNDIAGIETYIASLSDADRRTRYMGTVKVDALTTLERLNKLYNETLDYRLHAAFVLEDQSEIVGVVHAFRDGKEGEYELSFSRRSDLRGQGIGRNLMRIIIDWGIVAKAKRFHAITYRSENPRMRALFDRFGFVSSPDPDDGAVVRYSASLEDLAPVIARKDRV